MALERPPKYANLNPEMLKTYRPTEDMVATWHTVMRGRAESFTTIAAKHRVPVDRIIALNFPGSVENGRVIPEIVNWYLHHHRAYGGPETADRKNRMFKGGERVAIPFLGTVAIGEPILVKPKTTSLDEPGPLLASQKFAHEFKIPPKDAADLGYLLAQARISLEGEVQQQGGLVRVQFKKDQIKTHLEKQLAEDLKASFSAKADEKTLKTIADEVAKGSKAGFVRAVAAPFEASLKQSYKFGAFAIVPELGADFSTTPVVVRLGGEYKNALLVEGTHLTGKFVLKIGLNVGLSKKGWAWVIEKVGPEAVKRLISAVGRSLAGLWEYLVAEGIVAAGAIVAATIAGTVALTYLTAWLVADARRKGELLGLSTWYYSAYLAKLFRRPRPSGFIVGDTKMRDDLIIAGEKDCAAHATEIVRKRNEVADWPTEAAAIERYRELAIHLYGSESKAEFEIKKTLQAHIEKKLGL